MNLVLHKNKYFFVMDNFWSLNVNVVSCFRSNSMYSLLTEFWYIRYYRPFSLILVSCGNDKF